MERTDRVTKIASLFLFIALVFYIGVYVWNSVSNPMQTAEAVAVTVRESAVSSGIVIRDERVILSTQEFINIIAPEGKRVSSGQPVAIAFGSESALERASRIRELKLEIERAETLLGSLNTAESITGRDSAIRSCVLSLSAAISRGELEELDSKSLRLRSLIFDSQGDTVTQSDLDRLRSELGSLQVSAAAGMVSVTADVPGIFSAILDGYEHLGAGDISALTPDSLRSLFQDKKDISKNAIGKLITSNLWYFAAILPAGDGDKLSEGDSILLEFGRAYSAPLSARVHSVGQAVDFECLVVFSCDSHIPETIAVRQASAELVFSEHSGLRIPSRAVQTDEEGQTFVYTVTGLQAERKDVSIIYEADSYCLAAPSPDNANALRAGNEIIVSAKNIYDGKVLN